MSAEKEQEHLISLTRSLNINNVFSKEGAVFEVNFDDLPKDEDEREYPQSEAFQYANYACNGITDDDRYFDKEPFEILAEKMTNLVEDGSIKKRIIREGYGDPMPDKASVTIHYNAYVEYTDEPFDSTYIRKKPFTFNCNNSETILGLDIGTRSMKLNELSQFLVKPQCAYGPFGCLERVPPNATILYEVELLSFRDTALAISPPPDDRSQSYPQVDRQAHALCAKANDLFSKGAIHQAIKTYNAAVEKLLSCPLRDIVDQEKQETLLLRLYTNLVVSYTKIGEARRACINCNQIYRLCKGTSLKVPAKVYFNHGRCLIRLADYDWAERKLRLAQKMEPNNLEVTKELLKLDEKRTQSRKREEEMARAMFRHKPSVGADREFKKAMARYCDELLADSTSEIYNLPGDLTEQEIDFCKAEATAHRLEFCSKRQGEKTVYYIHKAQESEKR